MRGPQAVEWIQAVREEIAPFRLLGVYEELPRERKSATSTSLPARTRLRPLSRMWDLPAVPRRRLDL